MKPGICCVYSVNQQDGLSNLQIVQKTVINYQGVLWATLQRMLEEVKSEHSVLHSALLATDPIQEEMNDILTVSFFSVHSVIPAFNLTSNPP